MTETAVPEMPNPSMGGRLGHLVDRAHLLAKLSYQVTTLVAMIASKPEVEPGDTQALRVAFKSFTGTLQDIRKCGETFLKDLDPAVLQIISGAFTRSNDQAIDCFVEGAHGFIADLTAGKVVGPAETQELIRLVGGDLSVALDAVLDAARLAFDLGHKDTEAMAYTDDLTGLPNRRALHELNQRVARAISDQVQVTLFLLDLDRFKAINDSLGHSAGDTALTHATTSLRRHTRDADFVARVGGDEFALLTFGPFSQEALAKRALAIIRDISAPFKVKDKTCAVGASVGIAISHPGEGLSLEALTNNADLALYAAKNEGRGRHRFFTGKLRTRREEFDSISRQIIDGLKRDEFCPYFQPQVDGRTGALVGLEALMRWRHPTRGVLTPFHFMEIAEERDLLESLDDVMMRKSFEALQTWRGDFLAVPQVSINLSAQRLSDDTFADTLRWNSENYGLEPQMIGLEILESAMVEGDNTAMIENARRLSAAGFKIELDDFGTGHASIANLRHFAVDRIKIDKSFIKDLHIYTDLSKITSAMIGLAHSLRIDALAEGVESPEERLVLNALGCDHIQGFGVARPMPFEDVADWINRTQRPIKLPGRLSAAS